MHARGILSDGDYGYTSRASNVGNGLQAVPWDGLKTVPNVPN